MAAARAVFVTAIVAASLTATVSGCASTSPHAAAQSQPTSTITTAPPATTSAAAPAPDPTSSSAASPPTAGSNTTVVRLASAYSPAAVQLTAGQQLLITVSADVQATQDGVPNNCAPGTALSTGNGLLTGRCTADGVSYTAAHAGTATLSATVGPHCSPGTMCAQWRTRPTLTVTIH